MFVDKEGGESGPLVHFPHSLLQNVTFLVSVWLSGVMINTARHGKIPAFTMEGVVLVCKASVSPVFASQVHLADLWEPKASI